MSEARALVSRLVPGFQELDERYHERKDASESCERFIVKLRALTERKHRAAKTHEEWRYVVMLHEALVETTAYRLTLVEDMRQCSQEIIDLLKHIK